MKRLFFFLLIPFFVSSCTKPARVVDNSQAKIELKIDGQLKQYFQIQAARITTNGKYQFSFVATKEPTTTNFFSIQITTDSLRTGVYNIRKDGLAMFREEGTIATNVNGEGIVLIVSKYENGLVTGNFSGTLYNQTNSSISQVIEGKMNSVLLQIK